MVATTFQNLSSRIDRVRSLFTTRDFIFHDGKALRRFSISGRAQALLAGTAAVTLAFSAYGVASAAVGAVAATGIAGTPASPEARMIRMRAEMMAMQADVAALKLATRVHAARVEQRQALIAAVLSGKGDPEKLVAAIQPVSVDSHGTGTVLAPLQRIEARQVALARAAQRATEERLAMTTSHLRRLGVAPERFVSGGMGGPFEAADSAEAAAELNSADSDAQFKTLFQTWKKLDTLEQGAISIPSMQPVQNLSFTSNFGVRSDPFRGVAAMHAGVDIPGPLGTPIYATADGIVARAGRASGYGNLVEINHGKGIETRYGHMSKILVTPNTRVKRGQLIGLMGSTGRSTGSHLHYEVRIDGRAVNPVPFLQPSSTLVAIQARAAHGQQVAMGGPATNN
ncbi:M23 family metallopeptidase [Sphingomonas cannabina]|uniref:M23 family metallopeptidase n=1 Tax=Sphingomonas cannabina TaxID=2899123 RepID=UPI001F3451DE|nr:M23 family metallopeptidase [Sphingomonas cannabina]UIJ47027.1 M23 family metallopeptidase [Sphingomonas cannabina]